MKAIRAFLLLLALGLSVYGQAVGVKANKIKGSATAPSGACSAQDVQLTTAGVLWTCASGTWASSGGGTTINSTNGQVPYRSNSTTFSDSGIAYSSGMIGIQVTPTAAQFEINSQSTTRPGIKNNMPSGTLSTQEASGVYLNGTKSFSILAGGALVWGSAADVILERDSANVLAQRNGANAQWFQLNNTYTNGSNFERLDLAWAGNTVYLQTSQAGTGTARNLIIGTVGAASFNVRTNSSIRWTVDSSGHLLAGTDNTYDFGASGATRPRTGYFGTSVVAPIVALTANQTWTSGTGAPSAGACTSSKVGSLYSRTDGGTGTSLYVCEGTTNTWVAK